MIRKRAPIRMRGEHAEVREITWKKSKLQGFVQRRKLRGTPSAKYNLAHTLAHLLFPKHFAKPVAVSRKLRLTYFEKIDLDERSLEGIGGFYKLGPFSQASLKHHDRIRRIFPVSEIIDRANRKGLLKRFENAGLRATLNPLNIGFTKKGTVTFFEIGYLDPEKAEKYAKGIKDKTKRETALAIIAELRKYPTINARSTLLNVHDVE
ncbi:MAG: hypothetical protein AABW72_01890 [archaeon]